MLEATSTPSIFTLTSLFSLLGVAALGLTAYTASRAFLPKNAPWQDRFTFIWLVRTLTSQLPARDVLDIRMGTDDTVVVVLDVRRAHSLYLRRLVPMAFDVRKAGEHELGNQLRDLNLTISSVGREYAQADFRWGFADETVVSLEILTVLGAGPLACYIVYQIAKQDPARHYWIIVLSTAELYGGWMTFCPEWITGSPNLDTSNPLFLWVYLFFMNTIWVIIPLWLMYDSYGYIAGTLRQAQANSKAKNA
ncbi:hypothetical protein EW146_g853 [Bondarzewia mesenterica]|uniref:EXPERA domain-containing protein n=1 Tax=Bondarzewia mesenterica TaxID=1095465 RepID=A0A4S4M7Z0_9AGAM|nr:hypothetical protein EW146_g853 [Bondarzewia mesenterica]